MRDSWVVIPIVVLAAIYLIILFIRRLGLHKSGGKPDCGCGSCASKGSKVRL